MHEYKRQHLNVLHVITLYHRLKQNPRRRTSPRAPFIFGGKAAPGYFMAKLIIKLINSVAEVVNSDPDVRDRLKVVFFPDYNVKNAQHIYPAADLSEQISTAGKEASGTGNMKFALNGALTIGTLDGANVEIREEVGRRELLPLRPHRRTGRRTSNASGYHPWDYYERQPRTARGHRPIAPAHFSSGDRDLFQPLVDSLLGRDAFLVLADLPAYVDCPGPGQPPGATATAGPACPSSTSPAWASSPPTAPSANTAREIWNVKPIPVELNNHLPE